MIVLKVKKNKLHSVCNIGAYCEVFIYETFPSGNASRKAFLSRHRRLLLAQAQTNDRRYHLYIFIVTD
jgi:hypothetical protein